MTASALEFPFADVAVALKLAANDAADRAFDLEIVAHRIGLSRPVTERIVADRRRQAALIAHAHVIIKALMPVEATVRAVIEAGSGWG